MWSYKISDADKEKLEALENPKVLKVIEDSAVLMKPASVVVFDDSPEDIAKVRQMAIENNEENGYQIVAYIKFIAAVLERFETTFER